MSLIWWSVPPAGVLYIYYILCHFHLCFLRGSLRRRPLVVLLPVPDPIFCFSHSSVPSPAHLPVCAHPAHEEKHDIISWHCLLPTKLSFCSPDNSFPPHLSSHTFLGALYLHAQDHEMCTVYCERQHCDWHLRDQSVFINLPDQEKVLWYPLRELPWADAHTMPGPLLVAGLAAVSPALTPDPSNQPALEAL